MFSISPYWDLDFFQFFIQLAKRIVSFDIVKEIATDELQLLVLLLLSIPSSLLGLFLNLRRMTMLANSLSHTVLIGLVAVFLMAPDKIIHGSLSISTLCIASLVSACLTVVITEGSVKVFRLQKDASIGLVFTGLFSLGIILVTLFTRNTHLGTEIIMGNIDALHPKDLQISGLVFLGNLFFLFLFFKEIYYTTFDAIHTKILGMRPALYHYMLIFLLAFTSIAAFRAMGIVLFLSFLTVPYLIMRLFHSKIIPLCLGSISIVIFASLFGVATSRHLLSVYNLPLSTSGLVVIWMTIFYLFSLGWQSILYRKKSKVWRAQCEK